MRPFEKWITEKTDSAVEKGISAVDVDSFLIGQFAAEIAKRFTRLLDQVGDRGTCKACGKQIWWITTKAKKKAPYTAEGINHFADCPHAGVFRSKK
jgi:hypothetical protein